MAAHVKLTENSTNPANLLPIVRRLLRKSRLQEGNAATRSKRNRCRQIRALAHPRAPVALGKVCALVSIVLLAYDAAVHPATSVTNGRDFFEFGSNTVLAIAGRAEAAYVAGPHHTLDQSLTYPPITMLLCWSLAALSYGDALLVWVTLGVALFALVLCLDWSVGRWLP
jgi:hypothetical protein